MELIPAEDLEGDVADSASPDPPGILHADLDAFFAAVEVLDDPSLRGLPLIIGHPGPRGVVSTASYEARRFGVHSAMPSVEALRRCPQGVWRSPRGPRYARASREVMEVFRAFTPLVEPLSLDEAFLDVRGSRRLFGDGPTIAGRIRREVLERTGLVVSIGVAPNKFLAKVASDLGKPDGLTVVPDGEEIAFLAPLPIRRLWGVGPRTAERLGHLRVRTIGDLQRLDPALLRSALGERGGAHLHELAHGRDRRPVEPRRDTKSVSTESTFETDLTDPREIEDFLFAAATEVARSLRRGGWRARTVLLKVRTGSFRTWTRSLTLGSPTDSGERLYRSAVELFEERIELGGEGVRLLGVGASGLVGEESPVQNDLFGEEPESDPRDRLADAINERLGSSALRPARLLRRDIEDRDRLERQKPGVQAGPEAES